MSPATKKLLERVESWPAEDQEELVEVAREIEARRTGVYTPSPDEERAIRGGTRATGAWRSAQRERDGDLLETLRRSMNVRYSRRAANDLKSINDYLSARSVRGAANVLAAIYLAIEFIRRNPSAAERSTIADVHSKTVRKYHFRIFYRVLADDTIEIVHVRHTARHPWSGNDD